jgi:hypothetical protein
MGKNSVKAPQVIKDLFSQSEYDKLYNHLFNIDKTDRHYEETFGRHLVWDDVLNKAAKDITDTARIIFDSPTLEPSYTLFVHYYGDKAKLKRHYDDNACTYTLDMCLYQTKSWDIGVNHDGVDTMYTLEPNQALAFYGNDQEHWRNEYEGTEKDYVGMIFFHFVEPDHWFFTKSPRYIEVVSGRMTEEEWKNAKF